MTNEQAVEQIYREFGVHWGNLSPLTFEGLAFNPSDPALVPDKRTGWASLGVELTDGENLALGAKLFRQTATVRVRCSVQSNSGVLMALRLADHALLYFQRGSNGIRFFDPGSYRLGDRNGWYEVVAQSLCSYDNVTQ